MITPTRKQRRYDHRLRELVRSTGNIDLAVQQGVPSSTARGWVKAAQTEVVTVDVADKEVSQLRKEVLVLRQRVARLRAMTRVAFARMKATGSSLPNKRILDAAGKQLLLEAVERARVALPLRVVLRVLQLSSSRYHRWKREGECGRDDTPSCPRFVPHQLTQVEIEAVKEMVTSEAYRHVPTGRLAVLAQRLQGLCLAVFSRRILAWKITSTFQPQTTAEILVAACRQVTGKEPMLLADGGIENYNRAVDALRALTCRRCEPLTEVST